MSEFDDKAKQWDQNQMHLERTKAVALAMLKHIPVDASMMALEFGAGTGLLSFFLKDMFAGITLMDTSREMLNMAEAKLAAGDHQKIKTLFFDLEKSVYTGEKFDIIFTQMVLHHIKEVVPILIKFNRMLKPGGYIAIADLKTEDGSFHDPGVEVHHGFDPEALSNDLTSCGFEHAFCEECFVISRDTSEGISRKYPVFLLTANKAIQNFPIQST
jgi:tRNA (cmo5U34)-methyltransferase